MDNSLADDLRQARWDARHPVPETSFPPVGRDCPVKVARTESGAGSILSMAMIILSMVSPRDSGDMPHQHRISAPSMRPELVDMVSENASGFLEGFIEGKDSPCPIG